MLREGECSELYVKENLFIPPVLPHKTGLGYITLELK